MTAFFLQIDYASLVDVRMVKHGHFESKTAVVSGDAFVNPTKATNEKLKGDRTTAVSCHTEGEGKVLSLLKVMYTCDS